MFNRISRTSLGILPRISSRNFSGNFLMKFLQAFSQEITSGVFKRINPRPLEIHARIFFGDFVQEFLREFLPGLFLKNYEYFLQEFLREFSIAFPPRGFGPRISLGISSRNFSENFLQKHYRRRST